MIPLNVHTESKVVMYTEEGDTQKSKDTVILTICTDNKSYVAQGLYCL